MTDKKKALLNKERYTFEDLCAVMVILRAPGGCPWDMEQTHASIRQNFIDETYEAVEAIDLDDKTLLCEELGDVLMQVVFHAQIEEEQNGFTMEDVTTGVVQKLIGGKLQHGDLAAGIRHLCQSLLYIGGVRHHGTGISALAENIRTV